MIIYQKLLDGFYAQEKANPRMRLNYDLRNRAEDVSLRLLNALEPGTVMPTYRHIKTS